MVLWRRVAGQVRIATGLAEEHAEMADGCDLVRRDVDIDALEIIGQDSPLPSGSSRSPLCAAHLPTGGVIGCTVVSIDEKRQSRRARTATVESKTPHKTSKMPRTVFTRASRIDTSLIVFTS